jgi:colanic acid biosynthesis glycosyl transferase WcaI
VKILLLNQAFYPDVVATAQYASDLATTLVEEGHDVTVVASRRGYADPSLTFPWSEMWRGVRILRCPNSGFGKDARWKRAVNFASFMAACASRVAILPRFDVIITLTSPPLISALAALLATANGARLVYWVMDLNPDEAIASGWLRAGSRVARLLNALLGFSLRKSDRVVVLDRFMATRLAGRGVPASKLAVVPLWSHDTSVSYDRNGAAEFRRKHQMEGKFVVMYSGNHSPCHPLQTLLDAMWQLRNHPDITFCFVGGGSEFTHVQNFARDRGLKNVRCIPYQPLAGLAASLSAADLHVVVMGDPFVGIVHPSKVYNIRRLGIPFLYIGPASSPVAELVPTSSFRHGDGSGVTKSILTAFEKGDSRTSGGQSKFARQRVLDQLIGIIEGQQEVPLRAAAAVGR